MYSSKLYKIHNFHAPYVHAFCFKEIIQQQQLSMTLHSIGKLCSTSTSIPKVLPNNHKKKRKEKPDFSA